MEKREIYVKNKYHLGDCIFILICFKQIEDYIKENNIFIYFYCYEDHVSQVKDFNDSNNVIIFPLSELSQVQNHVHDLWIGSPDNQYNWFRAMAESIIPYDHFFMNFYNTFLDAIEIPVKIEKFVYKCDYLIDRCNEINNMTNNKYIGIDFLINNGEPNSFQLDYNLEEWNNFVINLSKKYKVVTTQKVDNIPCTRDDSLTVKDIAAISLNIKNFILIESGVTTGLYNEYMRENQDVTVYHLSNNIHHKTSFNNWKTYNHIRDILFLL